jgi:hypothetical protein
VTFSILSSFLRTQPYLKAHRQSRHPERSASQMDRKQRTVWRGVEELVTFSILSSFLRTQLNLKVPFKAAILNAAPLRWIASRELYGAELKSL